MKPINPEFFINNRNKLISSLKKPGLVIIAGNSLLQSKSDTTYPFKQDSNFFYLTGINEPNATLVINTINGQHWVQLPTKNDSSIVFDGQTDIDKLKVNSGLPEIIDERTGWQKIRQYLKINDLIYTPALPKYYIRQSGFYTNPHRLAVTSRLKRIKNVDLVDIRGNLANLRQIKQPVELEQIKKAVKITKSTLNSLLPAANNYETEGALEGTIFAEFRRFGASGHAYEPIVAAGKNACTLHYIKNNSALIKGDLLLVDVGAELNNYAADITRTVVIGKDANKRQKNVIDAVKSVQKEAIKYLKPGLSWKDYVKYCNDLVARQLVKLNLITSVEDKDGLRQYFPHSISHYLGLDVHDVGDYTDKLQENMVITVEPGIYISKEGIGVRIEDDIVITKTGAKIL